MSEQQALKSSAGKPLLHLIPPHAMVQLARVREFGARKYAPWDWVHGRDYSDYYDAVMRHMMSWWAGEDNDPESGLPHLAHAFTTIAFLLEFIETKPELDNRPIGDILQPDMSAPNPTSLTNGPVIDPNTLQPGGYIAVKTEEK